MRTTLISTAVAAALVCGPVATAAFAASQARTAAASPAPTRSTPAPTRTSLQWQVCDKTHTDSCIELGWHKWLDKETNRVYPQCAIIMNRVAKASCIETAFKTQQHNHT